MGGFQALGFIVRLRRFWGCPCELTLALWCGVLYILWLELDCSTAGPILAAKAGLVDMAAMVNVPMHDAIPGSADCQPTVQPARSTAGFAA